MSSYVAYLASQALVLVEVSQALALIISSLRNLKFHHSSPCCIATADEHALQNRCVQAQALGEGRQRVQLGMAGGYSEALGGLGRVGAAETLGPTPGQVQARGSSQERDPAAPSSIALAQPVTVLMGAVVEVVVCSAMEKLVHKQRTLRAKLEHTHKRDLARSCEETRRLLQ
jgi:hypothetical protein